MMRTLNLKQTLLLFIFLGLIASSIMSPIASNKYLPEAADFEVHTAAIIQAKMAIKQGQFPIQVANWQDHGYGNAFFTYYSPLPYLFAGTILKKMPHDTNPYSVMKVSMWLFILVAGFYLFHLTYWLFRSAPIALLSSMVYILSPYFIINIDTRGDFTEVIAQCILPAVLYYTLRNFKEPGLFYTLMAIIAWTALLLSHLVTFVYSSFFIGLLMFFLTLQNKAQWRRLVLTGFIYASACLLSLWYIMPIVLTKDILPVSSFLPSLMKTAWLTPLPNLLSVSAVSPMPLPGNNELPMPLYSAVGWPILFAVGLLTYLLLENRLVSNRGSNKTLKLLLALFFVGFLFVWSPVNFWKYLPSILSVAQFSYRILTQTMWIGSLLFAFALYALFKDRLDYRSVALGILLIGLCCSSWITTNKSGPRTVDDIMAAPDLRYPQHAYLVDPKKLRNVIYAGHSELPFVSTDNWLTLNTPKSLPTSLGATKDATLVMKGDLPKNFFKSPVKMMLVINGQTKAVRSIAPGLFSLSIPLHDIVPHNEKRFTMEFLFDKPFNPSLMLPASTDNRNIGAIVQELQVYHLPVDQNAMPLNETVKHCQHHGVFTHCQLDVSENTGLVQLPTFYYPMLLRVLVDGERADYLPVAYRDFVMTGLHLQPGKHEISVEFTGISWANWLSGTAWIGMLILFIVALIRQFSGSRQTMGAHQYECYDSL